MIEFAPIRPVSKPETPKTPVVPPAAVEMFADAESSASVTLRPSPVPLELSAEPPRKQPIKRRAASRPKAEKAFADLEPVATLMLDLDL